VAILSFFLKNIPNFYFKILKSHVWAKKHFVEKFHQPFGEKSFQKKIVKYTFSRKKKKTLKNRHVFTNCSSK
jgi:hypothetical protein